MLWLLDRILEPTELVQKKTTFLFRFETVIRLAHRKVMIALNCVPEAKKLTSSHLA